MARRPRTRAAEGLLGGAELWPQVHLGVVRGARGGGPVCERRAAAAGWQVPAEPTMPRLNSFAGPRILSPTLVS